MNLKGESSDLPSSIRDTVADVHFLDALSPVMQGVETTVGELAHGSVPVLLIGERGTGKRTIARRIHAGSGQLQDKFGILSCSELLPTTMLASLKTTGATLYLEEIGNLSPECQKVLLDLLAQQCASDSKPTRVVCGTSRDLDSDVRSGNFREDLYYRLSAVCLRIPPLRQRKEDIPYLMTFFLERYSEVFHRAVPRLSDATKELFVEHSWPGNLRELEAATRAIVAVGDESVAMGGLRSLLARSNNGANGGRVSLKEAARAASREAEKELILKALNRTRWNRRRAAQELQISYKALLYKLKQIGYQEYESS